MASTIVATLNNTYKKVVVVPNELLHRQYERRNHVVRTVYMHSDNPETPLTIYTPPAGRTLLLTDLYYVSYDVAGNSKFPPIYDNSGDSTTGSTALFCPCSGGIVTDANTIMHFRHPVPFYKGVTVGALGATGQYGYFILQGYLV